MSIGFMRIRLIRKAANPTTTKLMESKMKETLEEAAERLFNDFQKNNPIVPKNNINPYKLGFIDGAKWQQEELEKELNRFFLYLRNSGEHFIGVPNEQFVKKYLKNR